MAFNVAFPCFPEQDIAEILDAYGRILEGNGMMTMGQYVKAFEAGYAEHMGTGFAVATNSCTASLEIALQALNVGPGDEVIVPCQTFFASGSAVVACGATPVFAEVDENFLLDVEDLLSRITANTRAVILVHFAGLIHPEIDAIRKFLGERDIRLIEDAAHAHGAIFRDRYAGSLGDLGCFSFYSTKIMTTGEGGMITGSSKQLADTCAGLRNRGMNPNADMEIFNRFGSNHRFTEFQAILGLQQLGRLEEFVQHRNHIATIYRGALSELQKEGILEFQRYPDHIRHAYWRFLIRLCDSSADRNTLKETLRDKGITIDWPYSPLLHLQPAFMERYDYAPGDLPRSERLAETHFCLPIHPRISPADAMLIADNLKQALLGAERRYG